jgi:dipeptidyl aminopeptidase/acylaminoacyl peptidase
MNCEQPLVAVPTRSPQHVPVATSSIGTPASARWQPRHQVKSTTAMVAALLLVIAACAISPRAQDAPQAKPLTPEASLNLKFLSDLQLSPDGTRLAFVVTEAPTDDGRATHIWLYDKRTNTTRQFTYSKKSEKWPRWSPDGKQLAFLSNRAGIPGPANTNEDQQQIYVMRADGGEPSALTKGKRSVTALAWSPDSKQIAYLAPDAKTEAEEKKEKDKDDAHVTDKEEKHARLWLLNVATQETKAITDAKWEVSEIAWQPSGDSAVAVATDHPESDQETNRLFAIKIFDGAMSLLAAPRGPFGALKISQQGRIASFVGAREDGPEPHDLMLLDISHGGNTAPKNLTGIALDRQIFDYQWTKTGGVALIAADGFRTTFRFFDPQGAMQDSASASLSVNPAAFVLAETGVILVGQSATQPQELYSWDEKSAPVQLTHLNDAWKQFALIKPEFYKYKSFDGVEIEAALLKPANYDGKSPLPLITLIHGGPTGAWQDTIETWGQLLAARGYAVFYPNIRGSIGYGQKFVEMNRGDWGGADFKDVMTGIDDLVAKGIADPKKLGIGGWSYGGYMSEWAITQTTRFKAAVSGAGLANLISEYGTEEGPSYDEWFYGLPYEKPEGFLNSSPFLHLKNAKTPMLILQGDADTTDPPGQSQELYRGLKRYSVETELVMYPREPHGFHEAKHLLDRVNRILNWFDTHLKTFVTVEAK